MHVPLLQVCEGCQCSAVGLTMYQPFISRCHKCELINGKMHLLTARRFGVDPEFPWEAFRKTQLADHESLRQVGHLLPISVTKPHSVLQNACQRIHEQV